MASVDSVTVNIKWGKQVFKDVEINLAEPGEVVKAQMFALSQVPPERQKIMVKGGFLKDDTDLRKLGLKPGQTLMMMGTADEIVKPPEEKVQFVEDMAPEELQGLVMSGMPPGLTNLGNTCYMNSTLQTLASVPEFRELVASAPGARNEMDPNQNMLVATRDLFKLMDRKGQPAMPLSFLGTMRAAFPQFAERGNDGNFAQQDAEECLTALLSSIGQKLKTTDGRSVVEEFFGIDLTTKLTCAEDPSETATETERLLKLPCHIELETNYLHEGIMRSMEGSLEKRSHNLGRDSVFNKVSRISRLPQYLFVQQVRFFYRTDTKKKAKVLRQIKFGFDIDLLDMLADDLKPVVLANRRILEERKEAEEERKRKEIAALGAKEAPEDEAPDAPDAAGAAAVASPGGGGDTEMTEASDAKASDANPDSRVTARFSLSAILTHQGRYADGGHYVAWVKQQDNSWIKFDDDKISVVTEDEVKKLDGGGDWHMAYIMLYKQTLV